MTIESSKKPIPIIAATAGIPFGAFLSPEDVAWMGTYLKEAGFTGVSVLPHRQINDETISLLPHDNIVAEDAWNSPFSNFFPLATAEGLLGQLYRHATHDQRKLPPKLVDGMFFLNQTTSRQIVESIMAKYPQAYYASVHIEGPDYLESLFYKRTILHPQREHKRHIFTIDELMRIANQRNLKFLYDPTHLITQKPQRDIDWTTAQEEVRTLRGYISAIDIPLNNQTIQQLHHGRGGVVNYLQSTLDQEPTLAFVRLEWVMPLFAQLPIIRRQYQRCEINRINEVIQSVHRILGGR
ncbi:MAG: hypothetical protein WC686_03305 [Candidatus Shapirobacteria bacterium]|jgi:hypothetical protein